MEEVIAEHLPPRARGSVQAWLRDETAAAHVAAERAVMRALTPIDEARYGAYLQHVLALFEALEPRLWSACGALVPDRAQRFKARWLRDDLAALGRPAGELGDVALPPLASPHEALGAAYVIEGSTLGGPVLLARLRAAGLRAADGGGRFLAGYGAHNAAMWQAFRAALQAGARDPLDLPQLRAGALAMFQAYEAAVARACAR